MSDVAAYRFYQIDRDGHITEPPKMLECASDAEALNEARLLLASRIIEVWDSTRVVARVSPAERPPQ